MTTARSVLWPRITLLVLGVLLGGERAYSQQSELLGVRPGSVLPGRRHYPAQFGAPGPDIKPPPPVELYNPDPQVWSALLADEAVLLRLRTLSTRLRAPLCSIIRILAPHVLKLQLGFLSGPENGRRSFSFRVTLKRSKDTNTWLVTAITPIEEDFPGA